LDRQSCTLGRPKAGLKHRSNLILIHASANGHYQSRKDPRFIQAAKSKVLLLAKVLASKRKVRFRTQAIKLQINLDPISMLLEKPQEPIIFGDPSAIGVQHHPSDIPLHHAQQKLFDILANGGFAA
jgi:hypothetical protein